MMKNEKGQALPLAILALTVGTLLVAPFLGHASSSLIGSRIYNDTIAYRNACDAGVEHGIWRLVYGGLKTSIPNPGNQITYQLSETINGVTPTVTVTTNTTGGGGTIGAITKTIIDTLDFDTVGGYKPDIVQVTSTIYAVAYTDSGNKKGYLKTISITSSGDIGNSVIDTLTFDATACFEPDIIQISSNIYAIVYRGTKNSGNLLTVSVTSSGDIGNTVIDTLKYDGAGGSVPDIVHVSGNYYVIAYQGTASDGFVKTVTIDSSGTIGSAVISSMKFSTDCYTPSIIQITSTIYAIAYGGKNNIGVVITISISSSGIIGTSVISTLTFDSAASYEPDIINVTGTIYAIAYRGASSGSIKTVSISSAGTIGTVISTLKFEIAICHLPRIIQVASKTFAIAYGNSSNKGYLKTVSIADDGTISTTAIDTFNFDATTGYEPSILHVSGSVFAIAYRGSSTDGYIITVGITAAGSVNKYQIVATAGDTSILAFVSTNTTSASILSWQIR